MSLASAVSAGDINPHISDSLESAYSPSGHLNLLADDSSIESLDVDGNGEYDALTDGLLVLRGLFGLTGSALVSNAVALDAQYTNAADIQARIESLMDVVDVDANGEADALTDGLIILRYLFGLRGDVLLSGVISDGAARDTALAVETYVQSLLPEIEDSSDVETIYVRLNDQPFAAPYYLFSSTENGAAQAVTLDKGASYKFVRTDSGHPFNIGSGWRESLSDFDMSSTSTDNLVSDIGSIEVGQSITLTIPIDFTGTAITYYCYVHSSMKATLNISDTTETPPINTSGAFELFGNTVTLEDYNPLSQTTISNQFELNFADGVASADLTSAPLNLANIKNGTSSPVGDYSDALLRFVLKDALPTGSGTGTVDLYVTTGSDGIRANNESQLHCQIQIAWSSDGVSASILEPPQNIILTVNRTGLMISTTINEFDIMTVAADELTGAKTLDIKLLSALSEGVRVAGDLLNSLLVPRTLHISVATTLLINDSNEAAVSEFDSVISLAN